VASREEPSLVFHLNDFVGWSSVIPGEQRETRNPGGITRGLRRMLLDVRLRGHGETTSIRINEMDY
jgi:hypothetical protein